MKIYLLTGLVAGCLAAPQYGATNQNQRAPAPTCTTQYTTVWDTTYVETETQECTTVYVNQCNTLTRKQCDQVPRKRCQTVQEQHCEQVRHEVCNQTFRTVTEPYTETECSTEYKEGCEYQWQGEGAAKVWVPIAGTCKNNPYEKCNDVTKERQRQVPHEECHDEYNKECYNVPRKACRTEYEEVCTKEPYQQCNKVPKKDCNTVHKKVPKRLSRRVPKKVCNNNNNNNNDEFGGETFDSDDNIIDVRFKDSDAIKFE